MRFVYWRIAWRSMLRNRRRTALTILAISGGTLLFIVKGGQRNGQYREAISAAVSRSVGHIQLQRKGYWQEKTLDYAFPIADADTAFFRSVPHVREFAPKLTVDALVGAGEENTTGAAIEGIMPSRVQAMTVFGGHVMKEGRFLQDGDTTGAVIGDVMARNLRATLGDTLTLFTQGRDGSLAAALATIRGIFHVGEPELDGAYVLVNLGLAQRMLACDGRATAVAVTLDDARALGAAQKTLERKYGGDDWAVLTYRQLLPSLEQSISLDFAGDLVMLLLLLAVIAFGTLNTVLMSVMERFHEFGIMMAMGVRPAAVGALVMMEAAALAVVGIAVANVAGYAFNSWWLVHPLHLGGTAAEATEQWGFVPIMYAIPDLAQQVRWSALMFGLTLVTALWPMAVAMRFRPVEAIRQD